MHHQTVMEAGNSVKVLPMDRKVRFFDDAPAIFHALVAKSVTKSRVLYHLQCLRS